MGFRIHSLKILRLFLICICFKYKKLSYKNNFVKKIMKNIFYKFLYFLVIVIKIFNLYVLGKKGIETAATNLGIKINIKNFIVPLNYQKKFKCISLKKNNLLISLKNAFCDNKS